MMFETQRDELADELAQRNEPVPVDDVPAVIDATGMKVQATINQHATTQEIDGDSYVVAIGDVDVTDDIETEEPVDETDDSTDASDDVSTDSEPEPDEDDADPSSEPESTQTASERSLTDVYNLNGLRITVDPDEEIVGDPTGDDYNSLPVLTNGDDDIPQDVTYFPVEIEGSKRTSDEIAARAMGAMGRPVLAEGESGSGKNQLARYLAMKSKQKVQRIAFSADLSVFDLVGEKDIVDGTSIYVLGSLAKGAMFGHMTIFDEVNMVSGDISSYVHAICERQGKRELELAGTDVTLRDIPVSDDEIDEHGSWYEAARAKWNDDEHLGQYIHPEFRVFATCNPLDYADTKSMNDAFRDRFVPLEHPYLDADKEKTLIHAKTGVDADAVDDLVRAVEIMREAKREGPLSCPITFRKIEQIVEMAGPSEGFMSFESAARTILKGYASTPAEKQFIADTLGDEL